MSNLILVKIFVSRIRIRISIFILPIRIRIRIVNYHHRIPNSNPSHKFIEHQIKNQKMWPMIRYLSESRNSWSNHTIRHAPSKQLFNCLARPPPTSPHLSIVSFIQNWWRFFFLRSKWKKKNTASTIFLSGRTGIQGFPLKLTSQCTLLA